METPGMTSEAGVGGAAGLVLVVALSQCWTRCESVNVDSRFAVIKEGKTAGSLFGFSVALHQQTVRQQRPLLLIGAPQEKAESNLLANQTGDMFACPITTDPNDCIRANLISSETPDADGIIDGMWLGVTVSSQRVKDGRVMACGHRYSRSMDHGANLRMIGKCYIRGNDLSYSEEEDNQWQYRQEVCNPMGDHLQEGMCSMGIAATITQTEVVAGAPGCYNWQGNTFVTYRNPQDEFDTRLIKLPDLNIGNIYIGYSVGKDSGVLSRQEETVVTGAPRADSKGSVILMKFNKTAGGGRDLRRVLTLYGDQIGSYFGNSIAIVDINNDGWKELIVGAPFYFNRRTEEGGAVYIFMNENGSFRPKTNLIFTGPKNSAFGMSVASIGDINLDGFQDFAVGAPYHGTGRVCVWMGGKNRLSTKPDQVIEGKDVSNGSFRTFGYSISGGLDVDNNKYPDLVVGSLDNRVALLRSRPVIHVKHTFSATPSIIDPNTCDSCVRLKVCFSYTLSSGDGTLRENIEMKYTMEADIRSSRSRVRFSNNKNSYSGSISMMLQPCDVLTLTVQTPVRDKVTPLVFVVSASLLEGQVSGELKQLQDLNAFPVLSQGPALTDRAEIHFLNSCGEDNKCESNLQLNATFASDQQQIYPLVGGKQMLQYNFNIKKLMLLVTVTNAASPWRLNEDAHDVKLNVSVPSALTFSSIRRITPQSSEVVCVPESLFLLCELGNPFISNQMVNFAIVFETSFITLDTQELQSTLQLSTLSVQNDLPPLTRLLLVDYTLHTLFTVVPRKIQTEFSGSVVGESAMKTTADIGSPVEFQFTILVDEMPEGGVAQLSVQFRWPVEVENEKWLLYISHIMMSGTSQSHCVPPGGVVNTLGLQVSELKSKRKRRDNDAQVQSETATSLHILTTPRRKVLLNCDSGTARCRTFTCPLNIKNHSSTVTVRARLWNSTMLEDYRDAALISIVGEASLKLRTNRSLIHLNDDSSHVTFSVDVTPVIQPEAVNQVPLWIIIVSVLAGILLLALIILLMWKCGFFRRANTREMYEAKSQKAHKKTQPSEKEKLTEEECG